MRYRTCARSGACRQLARKTVPYLVSCRQSEHKAAIPCSESMSRAHTLIVDDFESFRRFVCSMLGRMSELQVIGETSDGLEAVQKAEELKPDLILLDIGLPTLNGIEASHRISGLVPAATILFVMQESDADVIAAALSNGAKGYVLKLNISRDLLPAVEAVLSGEQFVST